MEVALDPYFNNVYCFDTFVLDVANRSLHKGGHLVALAPKTFDVLVLLVSNCGRLVAKDKLVSEVWSDAFVEENTINRSVSVLRKALGDAKYIETVPKHGYRFTADIQQSSDGEKNPSLAVGDRSAPETVKEDISPDENPARDGETPAPKGAGESITSDRLAAQLRSYLVPVGATLFILVVVALTSSVVARRMSIGASRLGGHSIAVLPFRTINLGKADAHIGEGLSDLLITRLSNIAGLKVYPSNGAGGGTNQQADAVSVGERLKVDAVLDGTIYRSADKVRVTTRLVKVSDQTSLWAGQFEDVLQDTLKLQDEIALQVVEALALGLGTTEQKAQLQRRTQSADAYQLCLEGRYQWNKRDNAGLVEAGRLFQNAIARDPNFALGYAGLADRYIFQHEPGEAFQFVTKALELDPNLAEAYATRGFLQTFHNWHWKEAEADFKHSITLNPGYSTAHQWYGNLLMIQGRFGEAKAELRSALQLSPRSHSQLTDMAQVHHYAREYEEAEEYCRRALTIHPDYSPPRHLLRDIYFQLGNYDKAIEELLLGELSLAIQPYEDAARAESRKVFIEQQTVAYKKELALGGKPGFWRFWLKEFEQTMAQERNPNKHLGVARIYLEVGEKEKSLDHVERAFEEKAFLMPFIKVDPAFYALHSEPRFKAVLHRMGLE